MRWLMLPLVAFAQGLFPSLAASLFPMAGETDASEDNLKCGLHQQIAGWRWDCSGEHRPSIKEEGTAPWSHLHWF